MRRRLLQLRLRRARRPAERYETDARTFALLASDIEIRRKHVGSPDLPWSVPCKSNPPRVVVSQFNFSPWPFTGGRWSETHSLHRRLV